MIRYGRNTKPLWLSAEHIPKEDSIPVCEYCGDQREFEFQVINNRRNEKKFFFYKNLFCILMKNKKKPNSLFYTITKFSNF